MRFEDLSPEDQSLLNTDLGEDLEKVAAEKVAAANEVYAYGCQQGEAIAAELDELYKQAEEEEDEDEDEDEEEEEEEKSASEIEFEKTAAELGAFIERGIFDTLTKLGSEQHGDPLHYYYPYIEEKVAKKGATKAVEGWVKKLWGKTKDYHKGAVEDIKKGFQSSGKKGGGKKGPSGLDRVKSVAKGVGKLSPYAAVPASAAVAAKKMKKEK